MPTNNGQDTKHVLVKPFKLRETGSDIISYSGAKVIGFPGDNDKQGELWGMSGDFNLFNNNNLSLNSLITYKDVDTT